MTLQWQEMALEGSGRDSLGMRVYKAPDIAKATALVLYLHGGSFLASGRPVAERPIARGLADSGAVVVEADYGGPSGFAFPQVLGDAFAALALLDARRKQFGVTAKAPLLVVGDEAGGNVAAGVAFKARDRMPGGLAGQILLSPMIDPLMTSLSIREADDIGMRAHWADGWRTYLRGACGAQHPYAAPCLCSRLSGVAPALLVTSQDDPLRDEALSYAARLKEAGVRVREQILSAGSGWTDIYKQQTGPWMEVLCAQFTSFVDEIRSPGRALA
jgi:acetyl esterase/lipase